jgi:hypothetical protein
MWSRKSKNLNSKEKTGEKPKLIRGERRKNLSLRMLKMVTWVDIMFSGIIF